LKKIIVALQGESPNKLNYQIRKQLLTCCITRKHATILLGWNSNLVVSLMMQIMYLGLVERILVLYIWM
jgi:hypothetical protein